MEIDLFSEEVFKRQQSYVHVSYFGYCCSISFDHKKILCKEYDWNMANSSEEVLGRFFIDLKCKKKSLSCYMYQYYLPLEKATLCQVWMKLTEWSGEKVKQYDNNDCSTWSYTCSSITLLIHLQFLKKLPCSNTSNAGAVFQQGGLSSTISSPTCFCLCSLTFDFYEKYNVHSVPHRWNPWLIMLCSSLHCNQA